MEPRSHSSSEARSRVLETADRLFYQEGIRAVGIDRIVAEAGVAKMTLYHHFPSKDELILATLRHREERVMEFFRSALARHGELGKDPIQSFFAAFEEWLSSGGFRGCAFQNAAVELADPDHPGARFAREHKLRFSALLRGLVAETLGKEAPELVPRIALLVEGAIVTAVVHQQPEAAQIARDAALALLAAAKAS